MGRCMSEHDHQASEAATEAPPIHATEAAQPDMGPAVHIKPMGEHVLVKRSKPGRRIHLPDSATMAVDNGMRFHIVAIGPGAKKEKPQLRVGDEVVFDPDAKAIVVVGMQDVMLVQQHYIAAVIVGRPTEGLEMAPARQPAEQPMLAPGGNA